MKLVNYLLIVLIYSANIHAMASLENWFRSLWSEPTYVDETFPSDDDFRDSQEKQEALWNKVESSSYVDLPKLSEARSLVGELLFWTSFNAHDIPVDEIPPRSRIIFRYGSVAKFSMRPRREQPYSGIFTTGAVGLMRLSLAEDPEASGSFTPAIELKFLVDDFPSINMMAMGKIEGQGSNHNFFAGIFSNLIPKPESLQTKIATWVLSKTHNLPKPNSVEFLAGRVGTARNYLKVEAPFQLYFVASQQVADTISPMSRRDFREDLAALKPGLIIFELRARPKFAQPASAIHVADLILDSHFIASEFGDQRLHFYAQP